MAIFSRNKKTEGKENAPVAEKKAVKAPAEKKEMPNMHGHDLARVLRNPRITEKASDLQGKSVYTFDLAEGVSKREIVEAVRAVYKVTPRKVAVITIRPKMRRNMRSGKTGFSRGGRKAYVYLKAGETIAIH